MPSSQSSPVGWGGRMVVFVCPCGYYDVDEPRLCPECGVGLTQELEVVPVGEPDPFKQSLHQAVAQGLMRVTDDGKKFELTDKGRELGRRSDADEEADGA